MMKKNKILALVLACIVCVGIGIGGTLAWLTANSTPVVNTFTTSDIGVELAEGDNLDLKMIPGWTITKDPKAKVTVGSEDCYLFVKVEKSANFDSFMTCTIADGWQELSLTGVNYKVYYKVFDSKDTTNTNVKGMEYSVLKDDQVQVLGTVTKDMMTASDFTQPTLTFTAYATQLYKDNTTQFSAADAWAKVNPAASGT